MLHVDDDPSILEISKLMLMDINSNFEIDQVGCADEAFKKLATEQYDVVISDYEMPQKDGLQFLKELREQKNEIPFLLFTGKGREEVAINALNLGADGYYNKQGSPETVYGELCHGIKMAVKRKATEAALFKAQTLTNSIINSTKDMIWSVSADDFRLLTFNKTMSDYFFRTQKLKLKAGMTTQEIMPTEQLAIRWLEFNKRALREGSFTIEYTTSKEPRVLELTFNLLKRGEDVFGIAVFGKDITERKKAQEELLESEERFRKAFTTGPNAFCITTLNKGSIMEVNDRFSEIYGYTRQELIGKTTLELGIWGNPTDREKIFLPQVRSEGIIRNVEILGRRKNGETFPIQLSMSVLQANNQQLLLSAVRDISSYKQAEAALRESESRYRLPSRKCA